MSEDTLSTITALMRDLFDEYEGPITPKTSARDIPQWDSLAHVQLIVLIEQTLGVRFRTSEIAGLSDLGEVISVIDAKKASA